MFVSIYNKTKLKTLLLILKKILKLSAWNYKISKKNSEVTGTLKFKKKIFNL